MHIATEKLARNKNTITMKQVMFVQEYGPVHNYIQDNHLIHTHLNCTHAGSTGLGCHQECNLWFIYKQLLGCVSACLVYILRMLSGFLTTGNITNR